jgi:hypothetical protein
MSVFLLALLLSTVIVAGTSALKCPSSVLGAGVTCNDNDVCCGAGSSAPECCGRGAACCTSPGFFEFHACCKPGTVCCQKRSILPQCCTADQVCGSHGEGCMPRATPAHVCLQLDVAARSFYYDITVDASGTLLKRFNLATNPPSLIDSYQHGPLQLPPSGSMWVEGVAFAGAVQTHNAWVNNEATSAAYWDRDVATSEDTWRFETTLRGAPTSFTFTTSQCTL